MLTLSIHVHWYLPYVETTLLDFFFWGFRRNLLCPLQLHGRAQRSFFLHSIYSILSWDHRKNTGCSPYLHSGEVWMDYSPSYLNENCWIFTVEKHWLRRERIIIMAMKSPARGRESTDSEMETLFANLSLGGTKPLIFSLVAKYSHGYVPKSTQYHWNHIISV